MKIEALNCPNCGSAVSSDKTQCQFCNSRLKTMACPKCLGLMFLGSQHCSHCGHKTVQTIVISDQKAGNCPRCKIKLDFLKIEEITLRECKKCNGLWADVETFENICADRENQSAVLNFIESSSYTNKQPVKINYVPCPDCRQLMNRNNFAHASGVIIDLCKQHGVWFDADELPQIIEFIHKGGLELARQKEKIEIKEQINRLKDEQRKLALEQSRFAPNNSWEADTNSGIRSFIKLLFD